MTWAVYYIAKNSNVAIKYSDATADKAMAQPFWLGVRVPSGVWG